MLLRILNTIINFIFLLLFALLSVAFITLLERKIIGSMQLRKGPNYVGFLGIGQPIADAVKLLVKEIIIPIKSNQLFFILSPLIAFFLSLIYWSIIPFGFGLTISYLNYSLLFIFALGGLSVYPVLLSG